MSRNAFVTLNLPAPPKPEPKVATNGNGAKAVGSQSGARLDPAISFFSPDGTRNIIRLIGNTTSEAERVDAQTAYAAAAYAFAAMRYRASRLAEPPLIVVAVDQEDGSENWIPKHKLAPLLEEPAPDYDMGELLFRTSIYIDRDGHALWVKDKNGLLETGQLTPYSGAEFEVQSTRERLRGRFKLKTARGEVFKAPEDVIYFHEVDPSSWLNGLSRLEVFLGWLNLGQVARATVRDLLNNAVWPSLVLQPDADWNPDEKELNEFKAGADRYAQPGQRGKPLTMLGGGTATVVSARIKDLIPEDILNRVESVCSAVFGIPAIILQFQVGMENSPWSQMAEARRMCYEDTIEPDLWRPFEKRLTRQLLRPMDKDPTHFIRFDTTEIRALQADQKGLAEVADLWGDNASLNEKRDLLGLEPSDDPKADEIPALNPPPALPALGAPGAPPAPGAEPDEEEPPAKRAGLRVQHKRRDLWAALRADMAQRSEFEWQVSAMKQLDADRMEVVRLANLHLAGAKADTPTPDQRRKFIAGVRVYLEGDSQGKWEKLSRPLIQKGAERAMSALASDLGFSFDLLRPELAKYVQREAGFLIQSISKTTLQSVRDVLARGIEDGLGAREIAKGLEDLPAFTRERALLVARTEATRVTNGAPTDALKERQAATGKKYRKRWNTAGDDRVREEHAALDGETVDIDAQFSNGLDAPGEPNCRCVLTYEEVEA